MSARLFDNLKQLGFNEYEARVYVEMLHQIDPLTAYEIGKLSGVPRSKVYEVVDNLRRKQFVVQIEDNPKKYLPVDPEEVFSSIEKSFRTSVNFVKEELNHLERGETIDYIFNIFGKETIIERSKQMIRSASSSILIAVDRLMLDVLYKELESAERSGIELSIVLYGKREDIYFQNVYCHQLREPDIRNFCFILLDIDFKEVLAGTMPASTTEGHGFWTRSVYLNNIMQDNIIHEISLGMLEEKLGLDQIHRLTGRIPDRIWEKAMDRFNSKFHIRR
ncbi:MAG: TrmB family transcriptional regulator [Spirochaetes bacterium]|nr:TrmB family transcriptional regulator [Spirochaetota bacterium]